MKFSEIIPPLSLIVVFLSLLTFSFLLNFLSALYSDVNLFKIDLVRKNQSKANIKRLIFILKNGNLLFVVVCICQVFLNIFTSEMFMASIGRPLLKETGWENYSWMVLISLSLFIALFVEIFARYLANRPSGRKMIFSSFFVGITYSLIRSFYFLQPIVKPRKKIFANSEQDIIRFVNNLTVENILEKNEAKLVQSAFNFDELKVNRVITPKKKVITINYDMSYSEIESIHSQHFFTRYPVVNKKKEIVGIFNIEVFYWRLIKNKRARWQDYIDKKITHFSSNDKLDKVLTKLKTDNCRLAIVREKKKLLGIVTLQDVLSALVGKIRDEREILLLPRRLN